VTSLPAQLEAAFTSGYVWFDLLRIPQDRSERALVEISRQAGIFGNAASVVAWLNDINSWRIMQDVLTWFGLFYLHTNVAVKDGEWYVPDLPNPKKQSTRTWNCMTGPREMLPHFQTSKRLKIPKKLHFLCRSSPPFGLFRRPVLDPDSFCALRSGSH